MQKEGNVRPKIGVPWRTSVEEDHKHRGAFEKYLRAILNAGGEPVEISLRLSNAELTRAAEEVDGFLLPGSPADIEPRRFGSVPHPEETGPDKRRERIDDALLDEAIRTGKPVLGICYGAQSLNVHLHGTLIQDIRSQIRTAGDHDGRAGKDQSLHWIHIESGSLAEIAGGTSARVNSSHHQAVREPGRGLQIAARAPDGVIEAVEWTAGPGWILGVQWHPERMPGDPFAETLFRRLIQEAGRIGAPRAHRRHRRHRNQPALVKRSK